MAEISCFSIKQTKNINVTHNDRTISPSYLLQNESKGIEVNRNAIEAQAFYDSLLKTAVTNYTNRTHQKLQSKNYNWSAVVLIKDTTTMSDLEQLTAELKKKFGWQCYQIAIHRDEGHFDNVTKKTKYNLHAHLEFLMLDENGIYCFKKRDFGKKAMSDIQTLVAEKLNMKRGKDSRTTKRKHLDHYQYRQYSKKLQNMQSLMTDVFKELQSIEKNKSQNEIEKLIKQANEINQKNKQLVDELNLELNNLKKDKKAIQKRLIGTALNYRRIQKEVKKQLLKAQNDLLSQEQKIAELNSLLDKVTKENQEKTEEIKRLNAQVSNLRAELDKKPTVITEIKEKPIEVVRGVEHKLTEQEIKALCEKVRKQLIAEGWHTKDDYQKLSSFKKDSLAKLKKEGETELTEKEFFARLDTLKDSFERQEHLYTQNELEHAISEATKDTVSNAQYEEIYNAYQQETDRADQNKVLLIDLLNEVSDQKINDSVDQNELVQITANVITELEEQREFKGQNNGNKRTSIVR